MSFAIYLFFGSYSILTLITLVGFSRVYFRCHWIGDTLVGGVLGILYAFIGYAYFPRFATLFLFHLSSGSSSIGTNGSSTKLTH